MSPPRSPLLSKHLHKQNRAPVGPAVFCVSRKAAGELKNRRICEIIKEIYDLCAAVRAVFMYIADVLH